MTSLNDGDVLTYDLSSGKWINLSPSVGSVNWSVITFTPTTLAGYGITDAVLSNLPITGSTKTKITYDSKGLVLSGTDATTADISDSLNKRYVTDAQLVNIGNLSGTNTGDQTISLTGDLSGSGTGTISATISNNTVTFAKMQNVSSGILLGRSTASTGNIETVSVGAGLTLSGGTLSVSGVGAGTVTSVSVATANGVSGTVVDATTTPSITLSLNNITPTTVNGLTLSSQSVGFSIAGGSTSKTLTISNTLTLAGTDSSTLNIGSGGTLGSSAFTNSSAYEVPLTFSTGLTRSTNTVTVNTTQNIAKLSNLASNGFVKTSGGDGTLAVDTNTYLTGNQTITLSGDISGSGTTSITTTIGSGSVSYAKIQNIAADSLLGNNTGLSAVVSELSSSQVRTMLSINNVENTALSTWAGSTNITTVGTISTGTWNATSIADNKIASSLTGKTYNGLTLTAQSIGFSLAGGSTSKTLTISNTLTLAGTDSSTLNIGSGGTLGSAAFVPTSSFEVPLTFSTGLTRSTNTVTVNTTQNIEKLSNLTSNGFVKTSGGDGTLLVDTSSYLTSNQTITLSGDISGSGSTSITTAIGANKVTLAMLLQIATASFLGRNTASTGNVEVLSSSTVRTMLSINNVENTALSTWAGSTNITTVGTISTGTWNASTIPVNKGGTGQTSTTAALNALLPSQSGNEGLFLTTDGANASWLGVSQINQDLTVLGTIYIDSNNGGGNKGYIVCNTSAGYDGGYIDLSSGDRSNGGRIFLSGGSGNDGGSGGLINLMGGSSLAGTAGNGGQLLMSGADFAAGGGSGGSINASGGTSSSGNINISDGGGSIDTTGVGSIQFGYSANRITVQGVSGAGGKTLTLPNLTGTVVGAVSTSTTDTHIAMATSTAGGIKFVALGGDATISNAGLLTISSNTVTFAKMQNVSTSRLLGRSTAGSGSIEQITIGSGLSLSSGTLSATGGGVTEAFVIAMAIVL